MPEWLEDNRLKWIVTKTQDEMNVTRFLIQMASGVPMQAIREALRNRDVRVDGVRVTGEERVHTGQIVVAYWPKRFVAVKESRNIPVVYEDEHILLVNKPQGLIAQNEPDLPQGDSASDRVLLYLREKGDEGPLFLCHRLDVMTGGLLLFARDEASYEILLEAFEERTLDKIYTCQVKGCPEERDRTLVGWLRKDARNARVSVTDEMRPGAVKIETRYHVEKTGENAVLKVELLTGKTHQIRAHLAHIGHPILGDDKYGDRALNRKLGIRRQQLYATSLTFHVGGILSYLEGKNFTIPCSLLEAL